MAKKPSKPAKAKSKPVKKAVKAAPAKKVAKPAAKKTILVKKGAAVVKKAAVKPAAKPAAPPAKAKGLLKAVGKAIAHAIQPKKEEDKTAKPLKAAVKPAPPAKVAKSEPKAAKPAAAEEAEIEALAEDEELAADEEVVLTDAEGRRYCRVKDCDQLASVDGYCRYHYLALWKKIQVRKKILSEGKLERYIEELTARYPDKFLEILRKDLRSEKEFLAAIQELEIDENAVDNEFEDEAQNYIDEVRGIEPAAREEEDF